MRFLIKFKKEGYAVYTSHLDIMRLFKRSFKRAGIYLEHSQGFNPHPKMSFAQPLSLGYASLGEYLEFETKEDCVPAEIMDALKDLMPEGIEILECKKLKTEGKSMAALAERAEYQIQIPAVISQQDLEKIMENYLIQQKIMVIKHQKKSGKDMEVDIRPMIFKASCMVDDKRIGLTCMLAAGSNANLSPEQVIDSFCRFAGIDSERHLIKVRRNEIYFRQS